VMLFELAEVDHHDGQTSMLDSFATCSTQVPKRGKQLFHHLQQLLPVATRF
jgi:hypothetical protein